MVLRVLSGMAMGNVQLVPTLGLAEMLNSEKLMTMVAYPALVPLRKLYFASLLLGEVRLVDKHNDVGVLTTTAKVVCPVCASTSCVKLSEQTKT